jgi:monovalent cation:H+ antiporter, CPA1 family
LIASALLIAADAVFVERHIVVRWGERMQSANLPHIMLDGVLALLLFASSMQVDPAALRSRAWTVLALATASVAVSTIIFALGFYGLGLLAGQAIPLGWCLVLGALLAPTDAVVVEQLLRRVPIPRSLRAVIAGESLLNDGAAVVLFFAALALAQGETDVVGHGKLFAAVLIEGIGGGALGWLAGIVAALASRRLHDATAAVTVSLALALVAYRLAAALGISGPIAVVAAGLAYRHWIAGRRTEPSEISTAWAVIDDIINTFLFMLMGFQLLVFHATLPGLMLLVLAFVLALLARGFSICVPVFMMPMSLHERGRAIAVLTWSGLRGGISIALALTLPDTAFKDTILMMCYGVVILSILIQGLLIPAVFRALYGSEGRLEPGP